MPRPYYLHDPNAKKPYQLDWEEFLDGDTLSASTWTSEDVGVTVCADPAPSFTATITQVWLEMGTVTAGSKYPVRNHITSAGGKQEDQTIVLVASDK